MDQIRGSDPSDQWIQGVWGVKPPEVGFGGAKPPKFRGCWGAKPQFQFGWFWGGEAPQEGASGSERALASEPPGGSGGVEPPG